MFFQMSGSFFVTARSFHRPAVTSCQREDNHDSPAYLRDMSSFISFDLFIHTAVMTATNNTFSFLSTIFISLHFSKLTIETTKGERAREGEEEKRMTECMQRMPIRPRACVCVCDARLSLCMYR
jgi:hypothetical protein